MKTEEDYMTHVEYVKAEGKLLKKAAHVARDLGIPVDVQFYRLPNGEIHGVKKWGTHTEFSFMVEQDATSDEMFAEGEA